MERIININMEKIADLSYGANQHQKSALYKDKKTVDYEVINGEELTYNNVLNMTILVDILSEFYDVNAIAVARHSAPCGVALGHSSYDAYTKAFDCDPMSSFNGSIGFSQVLDVESAKHICSMPVKLVLAKDFEEKALEILSDANIKIIKLTTPLSECKNFIKEEISVTPFGMLIQEKDLSELKKDNFKIVTKAKPTAEQLEDAIFAWKITKHSRTNAAVIAKDFKTVSISQGYTNSYAAIEGAVAYACDSAKSAVLASDDLIISEDSIYAAVQSRISTIIHPGGSPKDNLLIEIADKYGISMITTGIRNCSH